MMFNVAHLKGFDQTPWEALRNGIDWQQKSVVVFGKTHPQPRLTRWYGPVPYVYSSLRWEADPLPPLLAELAKKVSAETESQFNSVLCNLYRNGNDTVGWHADNEPLFGPDPEVASLSYGTTRTFKLRRGSETVAFDLEDGDLFIMGRGIQKAWQHALPRTKASVGERINLTFRFISETRRA